jgi:hypothetical protein
LESFFTKKSYTITRTRVIPITIVARQLFYCSHRRSVGFTAGSTLEGYMFYPFNDVQNYFLYHSFCVAFLYAAVVGHGGASGYLL